MFAYIVRRLLYVVPTLIGVTLVLQILFNVVGGDPALVMAGRHATAERVAEIRREYGFDQPQYIQFVRYLKQVATFDFGRSFSSRQQISEMLWRGMWPSLSVLAPAFFLTFFIAIAAALVVAYFRGKWIDRIGVVLCVIGISIPSLAVILFGQWYFAYYLGLFPISGYDSTAPFGYVVLPALLWTFIALGVDVRFFRNAILDETSQDYVRTARSKGLSEQKVFFKHVLKNSMIPIITYVVIQIPFLVLGSLLFENFFGIPGLGGLLVEAISSSDHPVIKAVATLSCWFFIVGSLVTDILYAVVDPRVSVR